MVHTLTIETGKTTSNALEYADIAPNFDGHACLAMIQCPGTLPSITSLGFEFSEDGVTYGTAKDEFGTALTLAVSAGAWVVVTPKTLWRVPKYLRLKSNAAASGADRAFVLYFRKA